MAKSAKAAYLPPLSGVIQTRTGYRVHFQFVPSGHSLPYVVLTNHAVSPVGPNWDNRPVRFKFLVGITGETGQWGRTDAAEPYVDFADGSDPVPAVLRTSIHDDCLDAWEAYLDQRPELLGYARLTEINNEIVQLTEKSAVLEKQIAEIQGRCKNLVDLATRIRATLPQAASPVSEQERDILLQLVTDNCWLSISKDGTAELHPFNSPDVLGTVDSNSARRLVLCGFVQLHRHLADNRTVFKIAERGSQFVSEFLGKKGGV